MNLGSDLRPRDLHSGVVENDNNKNNDNDHLQGTCPCPVVPVIVPWTACLSPFYRLARTARTSSPYLFLKSTQYVLFHVAIIVNTLT